MSIEFSYKAVAKLVSLQLQLYHSLYYNKNWKMVKKCLHLMIERAANLIVFSLSVFDMRDMREPKHPLNNVIQ